MIFLPEDVEKLAALSTPENAKLLAEIDKELLAENPPVARSTVKGYVYFIGGEGRVKIGFANNVAKRLKALRTSCPFELRLLASFPGKMKREREFHERFSSLRMSGEWFRLEGALAEFLKVGERTDG